MSDAEALCVTCGLCCDGTFFDIVRLTPGEAVVMTRLGLPATVRGDFHSMPQPCHALEGTACRVYEQRPARCSAYRCHLLIALAEGEVSAPEARATVALAHELRGVQREQFLDLHFRGLSRRRR